MIQTTEGWLPEGKGGGRRMKKINGVKHTVAEGDHALGGERTAEHTDVVL